MTAQIRRIQPIRYTRLIQRIYAYLYIIKCVVPLLELLDNCSERYVAEEGITIPR